MAYRLKPGGETVEAGIRRIAGEEFAKIVEILANPALPPPKQVHEVRKCTKRLRSILHLVAPVFDKAAAENAVLRDAARSLSASRDASAVLDSLGRLKLSADVVSEIETALDFAPIGPDATEQLAARLKVFARDIKSTSKRASRWTIDADGFDAVSPGLKRNYRKLRTNFAEAIHTGEEDVTHSWRKSAKIHWHHSLLLSRICPDAMDAHARMASRLSESLGDWRDNGLLIAALDTVATDRLDKDILKVAQRAAKRDQKRLIKKAERISWLLTAETPKALTNRLAAYWEAGTS